MKRTAFFTVLILICSVAFSQESTKAFTTGETLKYSLYYGIMDGGEATISLEKTKNGEFHAKAVAKTVNPVEEPVKSTAEVAKVEEAAKPAEVQQPVATPVAAPVAAPVAEAPKPAAPAEAFPELTADKILASNGRLVIIIGDDEFNRTTMTANAGGYLSSENGKKYINTILTPDQNYQTLEQTKEYMVAFYPNGAKQPSVVMRCLNVTKEKPGPGRANIFVGEITNVETR